MCYHGNETFGVLLFRRIVCAARCMVPVECTLYCSVLEKTVCLHSPGTNSVDKVLAKVCRYLCLTSCLIGMSEVSNENIWAVLAT